MKALTDNQIAEVRQRYATGESSYKLADEYFCSRQTIWMYVRDIKDRQKPSGRKLSDEVVQRIRKAYMAGVNKNDIAGMMGICSETVYRYVKDLVKQKRAIWGLRKGA